jgi:hypothetical protein
MDTPVTKKCLILEDSDESDESDESDAEKSPVYKNKSQSPKSSKKSTKKSTSKSTPKKHKGPRGGVYIIRKGRKIYQ